MTSSEIRQSFFNFFEAKGHTIVPSSSLLPDSPNLLFTNAGMNQFVPIFLGQQTPPYSPPRAVDTQKCMRAGGKHNDLEDVGFDTCHHTFFEMLGNWSFGEASAKDGIGRGYFKKEVIEWAWELLTKVWKFPKERLYATVYKPAEVDPAEFDQEACDCWEKVFESAGLDPKEHILTFGKKDNFWMMGDTGPCGPCSEIHIDLTPKGDSKGKLVNAGLAQCIEIWNLVFIQFNAKEDGSFENLPAKHVDTGAGFERICSIIQCTKNFTDFSGIISNYETDVFRPLFGAIEKISGKRYTSTLPKGDRHTEDEQKDIAFRVIADHIRTLSFAIADGILPSNEGRGYVLRRILRRAARFGRNLGMHKPFFHKLAEVVVTQMDEVFPELKKQQKKIEQTIHAEEQSFNQTLERGIQIFDEAIRKLGRESAPQQKQPETVFPAEIAFKLYDTYGFPLDLTDLMAREAGLTVDHAGFEKLMEEQRNRAREAQKKEIISVGTITWASQDAGSEFVGFRTLKETSKINGGVVSKEVLGVCLDKTPFYAEMGGQVGDTGILQQGEKIWQVVDTQRIGEIPVHILSTKEGPSKADSVVAEVNEPRRRSIERHHTVTHLFHWALHEVVSREATQKGSYVGPDRLRFDFNHEALTPGQIADIERLVNERVLENSKVQSYERTYSEIRKDPAILQFFGEKYGEEVRVIDIGGFSKELCGGTHVRTTGEIGLFKIIREGAIAAGIRRIEAVAGIAAGEYMESQLNEKFQAAEKWRLQWLKLKKQFEKEAGVAEPEAAVLKTTPLLEKIKTNKNIPPFTLENYRLLESELRETTAAAEKWRLKYLEFEKELEKQRKLAEQKEASARTEELLLKIIKRKEIPSIIENLGEVSSDFLRAVAENLKTRQFPGVAVLAGKSGGKAGLVAYVGSTAIGRFQAGNIIKTIAPIIGGGGGGRPDFAQAGGKNPEKIKEALKQAELLFS